MPPVVRSVEDLLSAFDRNQAGFRQAVADASDDAFMASWTLSRSGEPLFTLPRVAVIRSMILNHLIHHRAQLGVYLRLNDVPVPAVYGPSADEEA